SGQDKLAIGAEGDDPHPGEVRQRGTGWLSRGDIPEPGDPIVTPGGRRPAVRAQGHTDNWVLMIPGRAPRGAGPYIPEPGHVILPARESQPPIGADGDADDPGRLPHRHPDRSSGDRLEGARHSYTARLPSSAKVLRVRCTGHGDCAIGAKMAD